MKAMFLLTLLAALAAAPPATEHVSRREFEALALCRGESVLVDLESARIFVEDYSV